MIRATPSRSRAPSTKVDREALLAHPAGDPDEDREEQERRGHLGEPPPQRRQADAEVLPRDDAVDHHGEREEEQHQHGLLGARERAAALLGRAEARLVLRLHGVDERPARVGLDAVGVAHHEDDPDDRPDDQDDEPADQTLADRRAGEVRCDAGRERIDRRAEHADPAAEQQDRRADERVVARRDHHRDDQRVEGEALLGHPVGGAAEGEHGHEDRDHPPLATLEPADDPGDAALDRAGLHRDAEEPADHEDEQRDVDRPEQLAGVPDADAAVLGALDAVQPVDRGHQRVDDDPLRGRLDLVVRARDRLAVRGRARTCRPGSGRSGTPR